MKKHINRILALVLCLCMLIPISGIGSAVKLYSTTDLEFNKVNNNLNIDYLEQAAKDLAIEQSMVDERGMIEVFIVLDSPSVLQRDAKAVLNQNTMAQMQQMLNQQMNLVNRIQKNVLDGQLMEVTDSYT